MATAPGLIAYFDHRKGFFRHGWVISIQATPEGSITIVRTISGAAIKVPSVDVQLNP